MPPERLPQTIHPKSTWNIKVLKDCKRFVKRTMPYMWPTFMDCNSAQLLYRIISHMLHPNCSLPKMLVLPSSCPHINSSSALTYQKIQFWREKSVPSFVQVMKASTWTAKSQTKTLISCPDSLDFHWTDCGCSHKLRWGNGKIFPWWRRKPKKCPLLSRGHGSSSFSALAPWPENDFLNTPTHAVFPSQG